jgi:hypothetical protein
MMFEKLEKNDIVFQHNTLWSEGKKYSRIYRDTAIKLHVNLPIRVCLGGFWAFRKTQNTIIFFEQWFKNWKCTGEGRDMPSLACAIKQTSIKHGLVFRDIDKLFSFGVIFNCVAIHRVKRDDLVKFGIPEYKQYKPFDKTNTGNWDKVYFDPSDDDIENDEWISKKFKREKRILDKTRYIDEFLPEIKKGGLKILDIATGPGEMLELAKKHGCNALGVEITFPANGNTESNKYLRFSLLKHREYNHSIVYGDINDIMKNGNHEIDGTIFDIINCQHAITFFPVGCFDFKPEQGTYRNNGEWIFNDYFDVWFNKYFQWCKIHLNKNGIVMIAALHATNENEYSKRVQGIGMMNGFNVEISNKDLNHKFRMAA